MERAQAAAIADRSLARLQTVSHARRKRRADEGGIDTEEVTEDGREYQIEIVYLVDGFRTQDVRVLVGVDEGASVGSYRPSRLESRRSCLRDPTWRLWQPFDPITSRLTANVS